MYESKHIKNYSNKIINNNNKFRLLSHLVYLIKYKKNEYEWINEYYLFTFSL